MKQDTIDAVMRELASRGGKAKSARKTAANKRNAEKRWAKKK